MRTLLLLTLLAFPLQAAEPKILSVQMIGDAGKHNAFTDLIRWKDAWYCTWRESDAHVGGDGGIRIVTSKDGEKWTNAAFLTEKGIDLRDPKLTEMPDGRLMVLMGGSVYEGKKLLGRQPRVAFSADGTTYTAPKRILTEGDWLWRVTWKDGTAYGVAYKPIKDSNDEWLTSLYKTKDGENYEKVSQLAVTGKPNETTVRFLKDGTMVALLRRELPPAKGMIGVSKAPYTDWKWTEIDKRLGGPNFLVMSDDTMWATGRDYEKKGAGTHLASLTTTAYKPVLQFPSGGDTSYAGMVMHEGVLWMSYYSSHEGKSKIYLAKVKLD